MSSLDGLDLFSSGPHSIRPGSWQRDSQRRAFPGLDGELAIDLGRRSRQIVQTGRLQAASAEDLSNAIAAIEQCCDGQLHTLIDNHDRIFNQIAIESFDLTTPINRGRGFWCEYTLRYRQYP